MLFNVERTSRIKMSPTIAVSMEAARLKAEGKDIISLGAGEPDFDTPEPIRTAAKQAIDDGDTRYTPVAGSPALKNAIAAKFKRENDLTFSNDEIIVATGAKQALFNSMLATLESGHEVIIPTPSWVSYEDITMFADASPVKVFAGLEQAFKINAEQLRAAITPQSRMLILNSPSNPTGAIYSEQELQRLADVLVEHPNIIIITDDIYEHIRYLPGKHVNILNVCPELGNRTLVINGVSKAYAMTGWRIGYAAGPAALIKQMEIIQSQSTSNPSSIAQAAAVQALNGDQLSIEEMRTAFKQRADLVTIAINKIPGVKCLPPEGAFYAFAEVSEFSESLYENKLIPAATDTDVAKYLLQTAGIALVPGSAFNAPGYLRLSFAASMSMLKEALRRWKNASAIMRA